MKDRPSEYWRISVEAALEEAGVSIDAITAKQVDDMALSLQGSAEMESEATGILEQTRGSRHSPTYAEMQASWVIQSMKEEMARLKQRVQALEAEAGPLRERVRVLEEDAGLRREWLAGLEPGIRRIRVA